MEWVNKKTGEVYEVEHTDLANISEENVNRTFKVELAKLISQMQPKDTGAVTINVKVQCTYDVDGNTIYILETDLKTKYPKVVIDNGTPKHCMEDGTITQPKVKGLFANGQ
ncbi:MAG: hypothetical protein IJ516_05500 [Phascolarctobacterium sp.]|nr:hypothetical protein [Phascolarctobacterium sp.]